MVAFPIPYQDVGSSGTLATPPHPTSLKDPTQPYSPIISSHRREGHLCPLDKTEGKEKLLSSLYKRFPLYDNGN